MPYTPTVYVDGVDFETPTNPGDPEVNAANLNKVENAVAALADAIDSGTGLWWLSAGTSVGATTITITGGMPPGFSSRCNIIAIGVGTATCELRAVSSVSGQTITLDRALAYAHTTSDCVVWGPDATFPLSFWGAVGNNSTDDTAACQAALDQSAAVGNTANGMAWLTGNGCRYVITRPLIFPQHVRVKKIGKFKASNATWGTWGAVAESTNAMGISCQDQPVTFTVDTATNVLTCSGNHNSAAGNKVVVIGSSLPSGLISGRVYRVYAAPSGTTLTLTPQCSNPAAVSASAATVTVGETTAFPSSGTLKVGSSTFTYTGKTATTFTGCSGTPAIAAGSNIYLDAAIDITTAGSGTMTLYPDVNSLERVYFDDVYFDGGAVTNLNGFLGAFQQPGEWRKTRFDSFPGYGIKVTGQIAHFFNTEIVTCGIGIVLTQNSTGLEFFGVNFAPCTIASVKVELGANNNGMWGVWVERSPIGIWFANGLTYANVFDQVLFSMANTTDPCVKVEMGAANSGAFELRVMRFNNSAQLVIDDVDRGFQLTATQIDQHQLCLNRYSQPSGPVAPIIDNLSSRSITTTSTATLADSTMLCSASGGALTLNLPSAVGIKGKRYWAKKTDSSGNAVTVDPSGSQTIDGAATVALSAQYANLQVESDGANWMKVGT